MDNPEPDIVAKMIAVGLGAGGGLVKLFADVLSEKSKLSWVATILIACIGAFLGYMADEVMVQTGHPSWGSMAAGGIGAMGRDGLQFFTTKIAAVIKS